MAVTAKSIITTLAVDILQDPTSIKWTIPELARYFNQSQSELVQFRPDLCCKTATITCVAGSVQSLPAGAKQLLNPLYNTGGNKRAVTMPARCRNLLDAANPNWRGQTGSDTIYHVMYDEKDPLHFDVYPPATTSASISVLYSANPADITIPADGTTYADVTGNMDLQDIAQTALIQLIAFHCYSKDANFAAQGSRASAHLQNASNLLGVSLKTLMDLAPRADDIQGGAGAPATST